MGIRQRGDSFQVDVRVGGKRYREDFRTLAEAEAREKVLKGTVAAPAAIKRAVPEALRGQIANETHSELTLADLIEEVITERWEKQRAGDDQARNARHAVKFFGKTFLVRDVTAEWVDKYATWLSQAGLADGTINRKLSTLSVVLKKATRRVPGFTLPHIERKAETGARDRFLTDDEEAACLKVAKLWGDEEFHDLLIVLIDMGLRVDCEAFALTGDDLMLEPQPHVRVRDGKGGKPRTVPCTARAWEALQRAYVRAYAADRKKLFRMTYQALIRRRWPRLRKTLKLQRDPHFIPHILRHTCLSRLAQRGVPLQKIQAWAGHATIQTTMRYAHLSADALFDVAGVLERPLTPQTHVTTAPLM